MKTTNVSITRTIAVALTMSAILLGQSAMGQNVWVNPVPPGAIPPPATPWDWSNGANWSAGVPIAGQIVQVSSAFPGTTAQVATPGAVAGWLQIGNLGTVAVYLGGNLTVSILDIAVTAGSPGAFALNAGALTVDQLGVGALGSYTDTALGSLTLSGPSSVISVIPSTVINASISGVSGLNSTGPGTLTLAGNNTYSGGTLILSGVLQVGNGGTSGNLGSGTISNEASLVFNRSNAITVGDQIDGTGNLTMTGGGVLTLNGANTFSGGTTIDATGGFSAVLAGNNAALGTGNINISGGAYLGSSGGARSLNNTIELVGTGGLDNSGGTLTLNGSISGGGSGFDGVYLWGGNRTIFTGNNTHTNTFIGMDGPLGVTLPNTVLQIGNGGANGTLGVGYVEIGNGCTLTFNRSDTITVDNYIFGAGNLNQSGGGTVILTANNDYFGRTVINAGALQMGNGGTTGMVGTNNIIDNSSLIFNRSNNLTVSNNISGTGSVSQNGSGTLILAGNNTFTGGLHINSGAIQFNGGSLSGSGSIENNSSLIFNQGSAMIVSNIITGTGSLTQMGAGALTLAGANSYSGGTVITNAATLCISNGSALGSGTVHMYKNTTLGFLANMTVANNVILYADPTFYVTSGATVVETGSISGAGDLVKAGGGTLTFAADNSYAGATIISNGTLKIGDGLGGGTAGSLGGGNVTNLASLIFNRSDTIIVSNRITGTGTLTQLGGGTTILTGTNDYSGSTRIVSGTLQVGNGGTTGSLGGGNITNSSMLVFNRSNAITVTNLITGSGSLTQNGTGSLTLSGNNTYTGGTTINTGTLVVASANALGNSGNPFNIVYMNGGTLAVSGSQTINNQFNLNTTGTFDTSGGTMTLGGAIHGGGPLIEIGGGTLILRSASSDYSGGTVITNGSTLLVGANNALGNSSGGVTMYNGTTLGFLGNYSVYNGVQLNGIDYFYVTNNATAVEGGNITGSGSMFKIGAGTLTLAGYNDYTGPTIISNGVLKIGDGFGGGTSGTLGTGNVTNFSSLVFNRDSLVVSNLITGTGSLTQLAGGTTILVGTNNYSGITTIQNGGTLQIGNGGTTGTLGTNNVIDNGQLIFNRSDSLIVSNVISGGSGSLTMQGTGTLTLSGGNSYGGGTWLNTGTVVVTVNNALGSGPVTMNGGTLAAQGNRTLGNDFDLLANGMFNTANGNLTLNGVVSGNGAVYNFGGGILTLNGANTYTGGTILNSNAVIYVGNDTGLGDVSSLVTMYYGSMIVFTRNLDIANNILLLNDPTLYVTNGSSVTESGVISGPGALVKDGAGTLVLIGNNTYTGATTVAAGTLTIGANGTVGTLGLGVVTNFGTLVFNRGDGITVANNISGSGTLSQIGAGTLVLLGTNNYTGPTYINLGAGALQVGNGGTVGTLGTGNVIDDSSLIFYRSDLLLVSNNISGVGALYQNGAGRTILTGSNTYQGGTWINSGTLVVGSGNALGNNAGTVTMNGGTLAAQGNQTVGNSFNLAVNGYFDTATGNLTLNGVIGGGGMFINTGGGTATLNNANGYTGGTSNQMGWLVVGNNMALGYGTNIMNGGTLSTAGNRTLANVTLLAADAPIDTTGGNLTLTGPVVDNWNGQHLLIKDGLNTLELTSTNYYFGTRIFGGLFAVDKTGVTSNFWVWVGYSTNNTAALVQDRGSIWNIGTNLYVGFNGSGNSLTVSNQGFLNSYNGYVGVGSAGSNNSVLVEGAGSLWISQTVIDVGTNGSGNSLTIRNQGIVSNGYSVVGDQAGANYNRALVNGTNTAWIMSSTLAVGNGGQFNSLTITNGALVSDTEASVGARAGANNNTVLVTGSNSVWRNSGQLTIGVTGNLNQVTISDGGRVSDTKGILGYEGFSNNVLVTDLGSIWSNSNDLVIGDHASANKLTITNKGLVTVGGTAYIGYQATATTNTVLVTGSGSLWTNYNNLYVGLFGSSNQLLITAGGAVYDYQGTIGNNSSASNNQALVTGTGSLWYNTSDFIVGNLGANNSLTISSTGLVRDVNGYIGFGGNNNSALVTSGATWTNTGNLGIGIGASGNKMTVSAGGSVYDQNGIVGNINGNGNSVLITDPNSKWINFADVFIGYDPSITNSVVVSNGAVAVAVNTWIGYSAGSNSNSLTVTDNGSLWYDSGNITVGVTGSFNRISILNRGLVSNVNAVVGDQGASVNNSALVDNGTWINSGTLTIGNYGSTNSLTIRNGGLVTDQGAYLGIQANANTNSAVLNSGTWSNALDLIVGVNGSYNTLTISNNSLVFDGRDGVLGNSAGANYNVALVDHSGWVNTSNLYVGLHGAFNKMTVQNAGTVTDVDGYVGYTGGNTNNAVVTGAGSVWNNSRNLYVGTYSTSNSLTIQNSGLVRDVNSTVGNHGNLNSALVTNSGVWANSGFLIIGNGGSYNLLTINTGGVVSNTDGIVGYGLESFTSANTARVDSATWINNGALIIGELSSSNALFVQNGGFVTSTSGYVGYLGSNNNAFVTGANSRWIDSGELLVGDFGAFNTLNINTSGLVSNSNGYVGYYGNMNTGIVNSATWINTGNLYIGDYGRQNILIVTNGGVVKSANGYVGFYGTNNNALVSGGLWNNSGDLAVGYVGLYNMLTINSGGVVSNQSGYVGINNGDNNTATVNSATWINNANLTVGYYGNNNALFVTNGGIVKSVSGYVGFCGNNNSALVSGGLWDNSGDLAVGCGGLYNTLTINNGGVVSNWNGFVGYYHGDNNTATVNSARWINNANLTIGYVGNNNALIVTNAGVVKSVNGLVGYYGTNNSALVSGGLWANSAELRVGDNGSYNRLTINSSGIVSNTYGYVGYYGNANTAVVNNARWINSADLYVGAYSSLNALIVTNAAVVRSVNGFVGYWYSSDYNSALVSSGLWANSGELRVGEFCSNNSLTINNSGIVSNTAGYVGNDGWYNSALVTGSGSLWNNTANLFIGLTGGSFNSLTVSAGGRVNNVGGVVGANANWNTGTVTGSGSVWNNYGDLFIGSNGSWNALYILSGGLVSNANGYVGYSDFGATSTNSALVDNGTWVNNGNLTIGHNDDNNTLTVQNTGKVYSVNGYIGRNSGGWYNQGTVTGSGSLWNNTANLFVGLDGGSYNGLTVSAGGRVNDVNGFVGANANWNSGTVTGTGSLWNNTGNLMIGSNGYNNGLFIYSSGLVSNVNGYVGYSDFGGWDYNRAVVDSSTWVNTGNLTIGQNSRENYLTVQNVGVVRSVNGYVGVNSGGQWNQATVTDSGSVWSNTANLFVGLNGGTYNRLTVQSAGRVYSVNGYIGSGSGSDENRAYITGTGSLWHNTGDLFVGFSGGSYNGMQINNGGRVNNVNGYIGNGASNNWANVYDTGSLWNNTGDLFVGFNGGSYNGLTVSAGGRVNNVNGFIGANANWNTVTVTDAGSLWNNTGNLYIGSNGYENALYVLSGGLVSNVNGYVGFNGPSYNRATVDAGAWVNTGNLTIGQNDDNNRLYVQNGGVVQSVNGYVGVDMDDNNAWVTGSGSLWNNTGDLFVGFNGGSYNGLWIQSGGTVVAANALIGSDPSDGNHISVDGGNLIVTNAAGGLVDVRNGSLLFSTGNIFLHYLKIDVNGWYGDEGTGLLTLVNPNPTIEIAGGKIITVNSTIAGSEGMIKEGLGELILTASNIYTGATILNNGTLTVENSYGVGYGSLIVDPGTLRTGSELTGVPIGINISGSYTQMVDGALELGVGGNTDTSLLNTNDLLNSVNNASNDWLKITGDASLNGSLRVFSLNCYVPLPFDSVLLIAATNGRAGTFSTFINEIPASPMLITNLEYHTHSVWLTAQQLPFSPWAITPNQIAVAGALDSAITNPVMKALFGYLDYVNYPEIPSLSDLSNSLPAKFDLIAPDELVAMFTMPFSSLDGRAYSFLARVQELRGGSHGFSANRLSLFDSSGPAQKLERINQTPVYTPCSDALSPSKDNPWGIYLEGNGEIANVRSDANASGHHIRSGGLTIGLDRRIGESLAIGITAGYANETASLVNDGRIEVDNGRGSIYAAWFEQGWHFEGTLIGGFNCYDTRRTAASGVARGKTDGIEWGGVIGGGYDWQNTTWMFGPQLTLQYKQVQIDSFTESGSLSPLTLLDQSQDSLSSRIGAHLGCRLTAGKVIIVPDLSVYWMHEYLNHGITIDSRFANGAGNVFTVSGPNIGKDSLGLGFGVWFQWNERFGSYLNYNTEFVRDGYEPHTINGGILIKF